MDITHVMPVGLALIMALSGCASGRMDTVGPEPRPLGRDLPAYQAPAEPTLSARPPVEEPAGTLSLPEVLRATLLQNPELSATAFRGACGRGADPPGGASSQPRARA